MRRTGDIYSGARWPHARKAKRVAKPIENVERTVPMKVHKNLVARVLREHPEDFRQVVPDSFTGTLEEYLAALEAAPGQYFVGGTLEGTEGV